MTGKHWPPEMSTQNNQKQHKQQKVVIYLLHEYQRKQLCPFSKLSLLSHDNDMPL